MEHSHEPRPIMSLEVWAVLSQYEPDIELAPAIIMIVQHQQQLVVAKVLVALGPGRDQELEARVCWRRSINQNK